MTSLFSFLLLPIDFSRLLSLSLDIKNKNLQDRAIKSKAISVISEMVDWNHGDINCEKSHSFQIPLCEFETTLHLIQEPYNI